MLLPMVLKLLKQYEVEKFLDLVSGGLEEPYLDRRDFWLSQKYVI